MTSLVAIDIETTGLDPQKDAIIEIGAVRFDAHRIESKWTSLINPGRTIPEYITQLTGITNQMVMHAPRLQDILDEFATFVKDSPVLGHNVSFDLSFLRRQKILLHNEFLDTYDMASALLPCIERYNLGFLAHYLTLPLPAIHRALEDAMVTYGVFLRLHEIALNLPSNLLAEIVRMGEGLDWGGKWLFKQALKENVRAPLKASLYHPVTFEPLFKKEKYKPSTPSLQPKIEQVPLDEQEVVTLLDIGGIFSRKFPNYEHRPQQIEMLRAVSHALTKGQHLMVEAGTGIGKSLAYLIPAALWAYQNNARVVISTNTINLQEQLIHKDIPDVRTTLEIGLNAAVLKGRSNYLCPRRFEAFLRHGPETVEEMRVLAKIMVWSLNSGTGDRGEINLNGPLEKDVWTIISAEDEGCTTEQCLERTGGTCPFFKAHLAAQTAHLLVVNHALLLADVATGNRVLPEYEYLIVDEAHHMEDATTDALSFQFSQSDIDHLIRELGGPTAGALGWLLSLVRNVIPTSDFASLSQLVRRATDMAFQFHNQSKQFFIVINQFLYEMREGKPLGPYSQKERILPATRTQPSWADVEMIWEDAQAILQSLIELLEQIAPVLPELLDRLPEESQDLYTQLTNLIRRFNELKHQVSALVFQPDAMRVYWAEIHPNGNHLSLHTAPLHIGPLMEKHLWNDKTAVILTSATLATAGDFDYLRGRLNAHDADELALGSPFDYETSALVYIVNDIPEPNDRSSYQRALDRGLINLCRATGGKTLVLFTSYAQLKSTSQVISPLLAKDGILVYEQGEGISPHALLETFRTTDKAVLLGTRAFWEGVDVPGEALSVLVISKLPFEVPTEPIVAARAETFDDPFYQYSLPEAILRFRQGFGRLIRTQSDRGVVAIFDRRVLTKRYGKAFIECLPQCTIRVGSMAELPTAATRWLNI